MEHYGGFGSRHRPNPDALGFASMDFNMAMITTTHNLRNHELKFGRKINNTQIKPFLISKMPLGKPNEIHELLQKCTTPKGTTPKIYGIVHF